MNKTLLVFLTISGLIPILPVNAADSSAATPNPANIRVVNCDEPVKSKKRGICANRLSAADFKSLAPGVSWFYNWHYKTDFVPPSDTNIEFLPMAWGNRNEDFSGLKSYLSSVSKKPSYVLALNEPNLKGQAFINPEATASAYRKIKEVADQFNIPVVGPHMAIGSADKDSIKAMDPIENKTLTYTFMMPFLKAFNFYMKDTVIPATAIHSYGDIGELKWATKSLHDEFKKPVWVTEYAFWKANGVQGAVDYLIQATDFLERSPYVQGYAWFKERAKDNPKISLLDPNSSELTPLGKAYVSLPPHDADLYYRIPGRLQAENYVTFAGDDFEIKQTNDSEGGNFQMISNRANATIDYNIQVDQAGTYTLNFRAAGWPGKIEILSGDQVIGSVTTTDKKWNNAQTQVQLSAGPQTLRLRFSTSMQFVNWIEFSK
jgi:hypothetical protein